MSVLGEISLLWSLSLLIALKLLSSKELVDFGGLSQLDCSVALL